MVRKEKVNNKFLNIFLYFIILSLEEDQVQSGGREEVNFGPYQKLDKK